MTTETTLLTYSAEELIDARIPFVKGVIYGLAFESENGATHCAPVHTFNGYVCDCLLLKKTEPGIDEFEIAIEGDGPVPVRKDDLLEPTEFCFKLPNL